MIGVVIPDSKQIGVVIPDSKQIGVVIPDSRFKGNSITFYNFWIPTR
jgi:hypothetical protein